jgi:hypothetical protein
MRAVIEVTHSFSASIESYRKIYQLLDFLALLFPGICKRTLLLPTTVREGVVGRRADRASFFRGDYGRARNMKGKKVERTLLKYFAYHLFRADDETHFMVSSSR